MIPDANRSHRGRLLTMPISLANPRRRDKQTLDPFKQTIDYLGYIIYEQHCDSSKYCTPVSRENMASGFSILRIRKFFSTILQMLREVSVESSQSVRGHFANACTWPRGNLRITYTASPRKNIRYL